MARARRAGDRVCVVEGDRVTTYGEVWRRASNLAATLRRSVEPGDRVVIVLPSSTDFVVAYLATLLADAIAVPLHPDSGVVEIERRTRHCGARAGIGQSAWTSRLAAWGVTALDIETVEGSAIRDSTEAPARSTDDPALILYTSGSTGEAKGVVLSHRNLIANTRSILAYLRLDVDDRAIVVLPFSYAYGLSVLHTHLFAGASLVIETRTAFPNAVLESLCRERVTGFPGVPSTFLLLLAKGTPEAFDPPALRYVTCAGGRLAPASVAALRRALPRPRVYLMYGATEASARLAYLPPDLLDAKPESIGLPIEGVEIEVRRDGQAVADGEEGELWVRGANLSRGYWPLEAGDLILDSGWYNTGDLGWRDADGCFQLVGRANQLVKIAGYRVSLAEVEASLQGLDGVADCAVVARLDAVAGERVEAHVVPGGPDVDEQGLRAQLKTVLPWFKRPARLHLVETLPRGVNGKILRHLLRPGGAT